MSQLGGIDYVALQKALQKWVVGGTGLPTGSVYWSAQDGPRVKEPAVELKLYAQAQLGQSWLDREVNVLSVPAKTVTLVNAGTNTFTSTGHGLVTGDGPVQLHSTIDLPGNVLPFIDYWIIAPTQNTFQLAKTYFDTGGNFVGNPITVFDISSTGSGVITVFGDSRTRRAGQELTYIARSMERCTLNLDCHTSDAVGMGMAFAVLHSVNGRRNLPSQQAILQAANIGVQNVERVRSIHGIRNAVQFEPRATLQVHLSVPSEAFENGTIIQRASGLILPTNTPFQVP
jgi:hypothetical protein